MAEILKGKPVADAMLARMRDTADALRVNGVEPTLCVVRVGERADDLSYEKGVIKRCEQVGVTLRQVILPEDVTQTDFEAAFETVNRDPSVHGILLFRPLPKSLDSERVRKLFDPKKDIDGWTDGSLAGVYANTDLGFAPCTAQAVIELLRFYGIDPKGKRAVVIGRSLVIGRPVSMLLMHANATVTTCHTRTVDVPAIAKEADILVCAAGVMKSITEEYTNPDQIVVDVGIHWDEAKGGLSGDVDFDRVAPHVKAITPVPGGVGGITTCVLLDHVLKAAQR
ncbi:MAG: bifunctional 5,10-methylenetetrahydrofolate dehydrogenase/5,10-methenyltetrahydrofolate cyclohydrolase [Clostridia bacterium]|nr:bifunctional 5,10-methylenetetrahydrofolate dehydrogenase/5,10-methenyltetrahydrofolate cyclohydrolase [Clostridia bacterium]